MKKLTLLQTAQTISVWIASCTTAEHLQLCNDAVETFIKDRFWMEHTADIESDLYNQIDDRRKVLQATIWNKIPGVICESTLSEG